MKEGLWWLACSLTEQGVLAPAGECGMELEGRGPRDRVGGCQDCKSGGIWFVGSLLVLLQEFVIPGKVWSLSSSWRLGQNNWEGWEIRIIWVDAERVSEGGSLALRQPT